MQRTSVLHAAAIGFLIAACSAFANLVVPPLRIGLIPANDISTLIVAVGAPAAWVAFWLYQARGRSGRMTFLAAWMIATVAMLLVTNDPLILMAMQLAAACFARALFLYRSFVSALIDLALTAFSVLLALAAYMHSGSVFLMLWALLLTQSFSVFIPVSFAQKTERETSNSSQAQFDMAWRNAQSAVRAMSNT